MPTRPGPMQGGWSCSCAFLEKPRAAQGHTSHSHRVLQVFTAGVNACRCAEGIKWSQLCCVCVWAIPGSACGIWSEKHAVLVLQGWVLPGGASSLTSPIGHNWPQQSHQPHQVNPATLHASCLLWVCMALCAKSAFSFITPWLSNEQMNEWEHY